MNNKLKKIKGQKI